MRDLKVPFAIGAGLAFLAAVSQCGPKASSDEVSNKHARVEVAPSIGYELKK